VGGGIETLGLRRNGPGGLQSPRHQGQGKSQGGPRLCFRFLCLGSLGESQSSHGFFLWCAVNHSSRPGAGFTPWGKEGHCDSGLVAVTQVSPVSGLSRPDGVKLHDGDAIRTWRCYIGDGLDIEIAIGIHSENRQMGDRSI